MTQRNIDVMDIIVDKIAGGVKFSKALKDVYTKRNVVIPYREEMNDVAITSLPMSTRTINVVMRGRLHTIGEVINYCNEHKITNILNVGKAAGMELFENILDYCWEHMGQNDKAQFLIDTVERNNENIRADVA